MAGALNAEQVLAVARYRAHKLLPYFFEAVYALILIPAPGLGTMAVTKRSVCLYDPETIKAWGPENTAGVMLHEVQHVLRKHIQRVEKMGITDPKMLEILNICEDAEIDDDLMEAGIPHPKSHPLINPEDLPHKDSANGGKHEKHQMFETYWADWPRDKNGKPIPRPGNNPAPKCGSCAGNPVKGEPSDGKVDGQGRSDSELERVRRTVASAIQDHELKHGIGSVPAGLSIWAGQTVAPSTIAWHDELGTIIGQVCDVVAGNTDYKYDRPSRRQWAFGTGDGMPILPRMVSYVPKIDLMFDTSGSMLDGVALETAVSESQGVLEAIGATTRMLAIDAEVAAFLEVSSLAEILANLKGGGGTSFTPAFEAVEASGEYPDAAIFFTDGGGYAPHEPPPYPVIWVECGRNPQRPMSELDNRPITWGHHILVPPGGEKNKPALRK